MLGGCKCILHTVQHCSPLGCKRKAPRRSMMAACTATKQASHKHPKQVLTLVLLRQVRRSRASRVRTWTRAGADALPTSASVWATVDTHRGRTCNPTCGLGRRCARGVAGALVGLHAHQTAPTVALRACQTVHREPIWPRDPTADGCVPPPHRPAQHPRAPRRPTPSTVPAGSMHTSHGAPGQWSRSPRVAHSAALDLFAHLSVTAAHAHMSVPPTRDHQGDVAHHAWPADRHRAPRVSTPRSS
jgi:hypothetical protein